MSCGRHSAISAVVDEQWYICGGRIHHAVASTVERFDAMSEVWESLPAMAEPRHNAGTAVIQGRVYVVGGLGHYLPLRSAERFGDEHWLTLPPMMDARVDFATVAIADKLYVCGGQGMNFEVLNSVEMFDPLAGAW